MSDIVRSTSAGAVFEKICRVLDANDWKYEKDDDKLTARLRIVGDDLPIDLNIHEDVERQLIFMLSQLPIRVEEEIRADVAIAVSAVNNSIVTGCFDLDLSTGNIYFRLANSLMDCSIGDAAVEYLILCALATIDEFNDKFLMLAKGMTTLEQFISSLK